MKFLNISNVLNILKRNLGRLFILRFFFHFLLIFGVMAGATYLLYRQELLSLWEDIKFQDKAQVELHHDILTNELQIALSDIRFIKEVPAVKNYLDHPQQNNTSDMEAVIQSLSNHRSLYNQVSFIDENGQEIVRVDSADGFSKVRPRSELQMGIDQEFFTETLKLHKNEVYISSFTLETENGEVVIPYQPTIRIATPVFDSLSKLRGVMVINYRGQIILDKLLAYQKVYPDGGAALLLNGDSYYLFNQQQPNNDWGFILPGSKDARFDLNFPSEWKQVNNADEGQFFSDLGLFTYTTFWPTEAEFTTFSKASTPLLHNQPVFKLVFFYPSTKFDQRSQHITFNYNIYMVLFGAIATLFSLAFTWGSLELDRQKKALEYSALHDALTGLPNRNLFKDRLFQAMVIAKRTQCMVAMYFIDLDGFKEINDTYGHDAGDAMLKHVSANLTVNMREADTLARLGGDEFCAVCIGFNQPEDVEVLGKRMLDAISLPLIYAGVSMNVTGSIGIAIQSSHTITGDDLIKSADDAMYHAKENGKNQYFIDDPLHPGLSLHPA